MKKVNAYVEDEVYASMMRAIKKCLPEEQSLYGATRAFVEVATSYVAKKIEAGDKELEEALRKRFAEIRASRFKKK